MDILIEILFIILAACIAIPAIVVPVCLINKHNHNYNSLPTEYRP